MCKCARFVVHTILLLLSSLLVCVYVHSIVLCMYTLYISLYLGALVLHAGMVHVFA